MMRLVRYVLGLFIFVSLLAPLPAHAQGSDSHYFDKTRHNVKGAFWQFYQQVEDAETFLGYPITEEFANHEGTLVQYFQRARLEIKNGQVQLSPLGSLTYKRGTQLNINNPLACQKYDTGFSVCFAFLDYFKAHGGISLLGKPISPFEYQGDKIVQYFQNGRLEWTPSNPDGQRVVMGELGTTYFSLAGEDPARLDDAKPLSAGTKSQVVSLNVHAFPWKAATNSSDQQVIFVAVQDQTLQPVKGVTGQAIVHWASGTDDMVLPILTNEKGIATLALPVINQTRGDLVTIDIQVLYSGLTGQTVTSFRIWY